MFAAYAHLSSWHARLKTADSHGRILGSGLGTRRKARTCFWAALKSRSILYLLRTMLNVLVLSCVYLNYIHVYTCIYLYESVWITYYVFLIRFKFHAPWWWTPSRSRDRSGAHDFGGHVREQNVLNGVLWGSQLPRPNTKFKNDSTI